MALTQKSNPSYWPLICGVKVCAPEKNGATPICVSNWTAVSGGTKD
jgi:hypothetical protein